MNFKHFLTVAQDSHTIRNWNIELCRCAVKDNIIYYGSMADPYIVMMQILETKKVGEVEIASKVSVQLQLTDPAVKSRDRVTKRSEKEGIFSALDVGSVWLERALNAGSK